MSKPDRKPNKRIIQPQEYYRYLRFFDDPRSDIPITSEKLGGKGASLARMTKLGLPVPQGFTLTNQVYSEKLALGDGLPQPVERELLRAITHLGKKSKSRLGHRRYPLIVSARSGAQFSMPGMMETILNIGLTDKTLPALSRRLGRACAVSSYARLIEMYGIAVHHIPHQRFKNTRNRLLSTYKVMSDTKLPIAVLRRLLEEFKAIFRYHTGTDFPQDPYMQLVESIKAVFRSWMNESAISYRQMNGISSYIGTTVTIERMVFGNAKNNSGTAVVFTRSPDLSQKNELGGHFMMRAQGEEIVAGAQSGARPIADLPVPIRKQILPFTRSIEKFLGWIGDLEVTWENGKVYFLQARKAKLPPEAALEYALELYTDGILDTAAMFAAISPSQIDRVTSLTFNPKTEATFRTTALLTKGLPVGGVGVGKLYFSVVSAKAALSQKKDVILVCDHLDPNDVGLLSQLSGLITSAGSPSSHIALIVSALGKACVMGAGDINVRAGFKAAKIGNKIVRMGTTVSVDGRTGEIFLGAIPVSEPPSLAGYASILVRLWQERYGIENPWAAFLYRKEFDSHTYRAEAKAIARRALSHFTKKAQYADFVNRFFPKSIIIPTTILAVKNKPLARLKHEIHTITDRLRGRFDLWPRSAYGPTDMVNAPYTSTSLCKDRETEKDWLNNPASQVSRWGGLSAWMTIHDGPEQYHLWELLMPHDPRDKLNKAYIDEHFVWTLRSLGSRLFIDISDHNYHVRSLATINTANLMQIVAIANQDTPWGLGQIRYRFGKNHFDPEKLDRLLHKFTSGNANGSAATIKKKIDRFNEAHGFPALQSNTLIPVLNYLLDQSLLHEKELNLFISDRSLAVIRYIHRTVLLTWWKKYQLPHKMWAVQDVTGDSQLEGQGRVGETNWIKIYGLKGGVERALAATVQTSPSHAVLREKNDQAEEG